MADPDEIDRRVTVEASGLLAASRGNSTKVLKDAAAAHKVDTAITAKVRQEFSAKEKANKVAATCGQDSQESGLIWLVSWRGS